MSVLCQIAQVDDEKQFMEYVKKYNRPPYPGGGWGRFYSEVPAIGTTLQIDWSDYESENNVPLPERYEKDRERPSDYGRVIHHHRHLVPKPEWYNIDTSDEIHRGLNIGHHAVVLCVVYVVEA
jgi:hypothetical protein